MREKESKLNLERNQSLVSDNSSHLEHIEMLAKINEVPAKVEVKSTDKLYNAQFVAYKITAIDIEKH